MKKMNFKNILIVSVLGIGLTSCNTNCTTTSKTMKGQKLFSALGTKVTSFVKKQINSLENNRNRVQDALFVGGVGTSSIFTAYNLKKNNSSTDKTYVHLTTKEPVDKIKKDLKEVGGYTVNQNEAIHTHDTLFEYTPDGTLILNLVESYGYNKNYTEWTFKLKQNIYFHPNKCFENKAFFRENIFSNDINFEIIPPELTADDVVYSLMRIINDPNCPSYSMIGGIVDKVEKIDKYTFKMTMERPYVKLPEVLTRRPLGIGNKKANELGCHEVGTGPFKFISDDNNQIIYNTNNDYHKHLVDKHVNGIVVHGFDSDKSIYKELKNGNLDYISKIPIKEYSEIINSKEINIEKINKGYVQYLGFNCRNNMFKDHEVRKAIEALVDKKYLSSIYKKNYPITDSFIPSILENAKIVNDNKLEVYSIEKAKAIIHKKGYKGKSIEVCHYNNKEFKEYMGGILTELGFDIKYVEEFDKGSEKPQICTANWGPCSSDPSDMFIKITDGDRNSFNTWGFDDKEYNANFNLLNATEDPGQRAEYIKNLDKIIKDKAPIIPIFYHIGHDLAYNNSIKIPEKINPWGKYKIPHYIKKTRSTKK